MNTTELLRNIFRKINRYRIMILVAGIAAGALLFIYAKTKNPVYTAKATLFPLTSASDNALSASTLSGILGLADAPKSFSNEAAINIIELALSRNVRESVAGARLPNSGNKTIAEILVKEANNNKSFLSKKIEFPADSASQVIIGAELLKPDLNAKMNKNGVLELYYSSTDAKIVQPIAETIIAKISQFYIDLRIKKALADYNFTLGKIDSIQGVLKTLDNKAISMQNSTFFTPTDLLEYEIPKSNLSSEKIRVSRQRDISVNNREEALWRLQKITPIIATLDKPEPPFDVARSSGLLYGIAGFILGTILAVLILTGGAFYKYAKAEAYKAIFGSNEVTP